MEGSNSSVCHGEAMRQYIFVAQPKVAIYHCHKISKTQAQKSVCLKNVPLAEFQLP
jgi:hypothetical protein